MKIELFSISSRKKFLGGIGIFEFLTFVLLFLKLKFRLSFDLFFYDTDFHSKRTRWI